MGQKIQKCQRGMYFRIGWACHSLIWGVEFEIVDPGVSERKVVSGLEECDSCNAWDVGFEFCK